MILNRFMIEAPPSSRRLAICNTKVL